MTLKLTCALAAIACGAAVIFVELKENDLKVLGAGVILAALAAVLDR